MLIVPEAAVLDQDRVHIGGGNMVGIIINIIVPDTCTTTAISFPHANPNVGGALALLVFVLTSIDLRSCPQSSLGARLKLIAARLTVVFGVLGDFSIWVNTGRFALCKDVFSITASDELQHAVDRKGGGDGTDDTGTKSEKSSEDCEEIHYGGRSLSDKVSKGLLVDLEEMGGE